MSNSGLQIVKKHLNEQISEIYELFDNRGKGYIDSGALMQGMKMLGYETDKKQIQQMIQHLDETGKGVITLDAFKKFMMSRLDYRDDSQQIKFAYDFYALQEQIKSQDLRRVAEELGEKIQDTDDILKECDKSQSGSITYQQFLRVIKKTSYY